MPMKKIAAAAAAVALIASAPAFSQPAPQRSGAEVQREGAAMDDASDYRGGVIIPSIIIIGLGLLLYFLVLKDDEDPVSP